MHMTDPKKGDVKGFQVTKRLKAVNIRRMLDMCNQQAKPAPGLVTLMAFGRKVSNKPAA